MLKSTGIVRRVDELGRIVLPKELRDILDIQSGSPLEIFTQGELIMLRAYQPFCIFCGSSHQLVEHHRKQVCETCRSHLGGVG